MRNRQRAYLANEKGAIAIILAFALLPLMIAAGFALDYNRTLRTKEKLQAVLDSAVLAGALQLPDAELAVSTATTHFKSQTSGISVAQEVFAVEDGRLTGTVSASVPTTLMRLGGRERVDVSLDAAAMKGSGGLELVMVLDVSGSMGGEIPSLRAAATQLMAQIYKDETKLKDTYVGLVPFGGRVNIIDYGASWMENPPSQSNGPTGTVDTKCKVAAPDPEYPRLCTDHRSFPNSETDALPGDELFSEFSGAPVVCPVNKAVGLNADRLVVQAAIDQLCSGHGTSTEVGMVWGWRMISPKWKGLWGDSDLPLSREETPGKYVVIMTDGKNHPNQSGDSYTEEQANERLLRECTAMKEQGITIFAVTFNMKGALAALYQQCTSKPEYNFTAESGVELEEVFGIIGAQVASGQARLVY